MSRLRSQISALWIAALCLGSTLGFASGCGEIDAKERLPKGAALIANSRSLDRLLEQVGQLEGTPLARQAERLRDAIPKCATVEAHTESGDLSDLWPSLTCRTERTDFGALEAARHDSDIALSIPVAGRHALGTLSINADGDIEFELRLPDIATDGLAGLALPGEQASGATELSSSDALIHARIRPKGGLDLASLVPADSQGARLFQLKSKLFTGLVLDGVWEIATYLPEDGDPMPRTALALNFTNRAAAVAAMEDFISNLQENWPVARSFFRLGEADGACLLDLAIMPGLAPCYVATERALVVGWNPASLRKALDDGGRSESALGDFGGAVIHLDRFADADRILSSALRTESTSRPTQYPWKRITAEGGPESSGFRLKFRFESNRGAS
jgi:hypothetical protein